MILIDDGHLGPDIWSEIPNQAESTKEMMRIVWADEAYCRRKVSETKICSLSPSSKEAKYVGPLISCYVTIGLLNWYRFWIQS